MYYNKKEQALETYCLDGKSTIAHIKPTATVTDVSVKKVLLKLRK